MNNVWTEPNQLIEIAYKRPSLRCQFIPILVVGFNLKNKNAHACKCMCLILTVWKRDWYNEFVARLKLSISLFLRLPAKTL